MERLMVAEASARVRPDKTFRVGRCFGFVLRGSVRYSPFCRRETAQPIFTTVARGLIGMG